MKRDLTELNKLEQYLKTHGVDYVRDDMTFKFPRDIVSHFTHLGIGEVDKHQIVVFRNGERVWDVVCHYGSYGAVEGLLEGMGEIFEEDVEGWLTADEVIARIEKHAQEPET